MTPYNAAEPIRQEKNAAQPKINTYAPAFFRLTTAWKPAIILAPPGLRIKRIAPLYHAGLAAVNRKNLQKTKKNGPKPIF
jgi:hypothetical protein